MKQYADMSNPHKVKGAEALLLSLLAEGTDTLFGYPGGAIIPVYDHLYGYTDRLHHILTRHEQGAVHATHGLRAGSVSAWPLRAPAPRTWSPALPTP